MLVLRFLLCFVPAQMKDGPLVFNVAILPQGLSYHVALLPGCSSSISRSRMEVLALGEDEELTRLCVDCGLYTGRFCDRCYASQRIPTEVWCRGQRTPLCSRCDNRWDAYHFCRGLHWCTPPAWGPAADHVKLAQAKRDSKPGRR